ncbi:MAG: 4Fe-4S binding protein [Lachnospiraceae bacterium]|nr:4Fe-4S binding protein [Lachnospiraceae bacterium]
MGILTRTLGSVMSAPERPIFSVARCVNRRQHKAPCTKCIDLCPGRVFSMDPKEPLHWDQCTNCGLCVSVCPSRCFTPDKELQKQYTENLDLSAPISFACYNESTPCTRRVECMAGIPWELIATLALYTHVVFYVGACSRCAHAQRVSCLHDNLKLVQDFLGTERFAQRVHILGQGRFELPQEDKAISRRDLFGGMGITIGKTAARQILDMMPFIDEEEDDNSMAYRQLLASTVDRARTNARKAQEEAKKAQEEAAQAKAENPDAQISVPAIPAMPTFGVQLPKFLKSCFGCNICERVCPHKALEIGPEKEGKRTIYITPSLCTGCGLCSNICIHNGMAGTHLVQVPHMNKLPLVRVDSETCSKCGAAVKPGTSVNGMCAICARKKRW